MRNCWNDYTSTDVILLDIMFLPLCITFVRVHRGCIDAQRRHDLRLYLLRDNCSSIRARKAA